MKKLFKLLSLSIFSCIGVQSLIMATVIEDTPKKQCRNLILILDENKSETKDAITGALTITLMYALQEQIAPIIVSSNILDNFCQAKTNNYKFFFPIPRTAKLTSVKSIDWHVFAHPNEDLFLLIPQKYIETHASYIINDPIKECGFMVN